MLKQFQFWVGLPVHPGLCLQVLDQPDRVTLIEGGDFDREETMIFGIVTHIINDATTVRACSFYISPENFRAYDEGSLFSHRAIFQPVPIQQAF